MTNKIYTVNSNASLGTTSITGGSFSNWNTLGGDYYYTSNVTSIGSMPSISISDSTVTTNNAGLKVTGNAEFEGDITIKGKNLSDVLDKIEERLAILHVNPELEEKYSELKKLGEMYRSLEKDILEKEKIWKILKK